MILSGMLLFLLSYKQKNLNDFFSALYVQQTAYDYHLLSSDLERAKDHGKQSALNENIDDDL